MVRLTIIAIVVLCHSVAVADEKQIAYFNEYIQPLLEKHCFDCHSHETGEASGGLVLDSKAGWQIGGDSGPAIVPGKADESLLLHVINHSVDGLEMPPDGKLSADQLQMFKTWIDSGAHDPRKGKAATRTQIDIEAGRQWWAFQPVKQEFAPQLSIDHFLNRKLRKAGIKPAPLASDRILLRRLSYDLTGLPYDEVDGENYESAVDRLLGSPQFGEKWGRHWLDLARYADSNGSSFNPPFRRAWKYRNWVINSFNNDLPINEFFRKQIAGDLLPYDSQSERDNNLIATGYLMLGSKVLGTFDKEQLILDVVDEQLDTIGKSMLGMTIGCARCHDHKFDPIQQADYYALAGFFTSTVTLHDRLGGPKEDESDWSRRGLGNGNDQRLRKFINENGYSWIKATQKTFHGRRNLTRLQKEFAEAQDENKQQELKKKIAKERRSLDEWANKLENLSKQLPDYAMAVRDSASPADEALRIRGVASSRGEVIPRGFLQVASSENPRPTIPAGTSGRVALADWIASDSNPLTARVFVNRVWKHLFREGLVRSVDNFGIQGEKPTHAELLDYLTAKFIQGGWKVKPLIREIVLSEAYRRRVTISPKNDPENRLLSHQNRRRLEPEELRDTLLKLSGRLDHSKGRGMIDHLPIGDVSNLGTAIAVSDNRRTVYQPVIRTLEPTVLQVFDAPVNTMATGSRARTIVSPQALYLLNSDEVQHACRLMSERFIKPTDLGTRDVATIGRISKTVFNRIVGREPTEDEHTILTRYLIEQADGDSGLSHHDAMKLCQMIVASTQFQFVD